MCVCVMHGLLYTNSYGYIANVLMLQKRQYIVTELRLCLLSSRSGAQCSVEQGM